MPRINIMVDNDLYLKVLRVKTQLQKIEEESEKPKNITFTDAVKFVIGKGLEK